MDEWVGAADARCSGPDPARIAAPSNSNRTSVRTVNTNTRSLATLEPNNCSFRPTTRRSINQFGESEHLYPKVCHTLQTHVRPLSPHEDRRDPKKREAVMGEHKLTERQQAILEFISSQMRDRGFPPSVREIGAEVGLTSPSTVHSHLATLQKAGYLRRDPSKPRAIEVRWDSNSGASDIERRPVRHVPLVGTVAAGTDVLAAEHIEETFPVPADLTGDGDLFMLKVRGDSMIDAGIFDGDYVIARVQNEARKGDIVVAGIPGEEATVKTYSVDAKKGQVVLLPSNHALKPMRFDPSEVQIFGKVVTVMRRL